MTENGGERRISNPWSVTTKRIFIGAVLVVAFLLVIQARQVVYLAILACLVAYLLSPIVDFLVRRARLPRTLAIVFVYLLLIAVLITIPVLVLPSLVREITLVSLNLRDISDAMQSQANQIGEIEILNFRVNLSTLYEQLGASLYGAASPLATGTLSLLFNLASVLMYFILILVLSFYLLRDVNRIVEYVDNLVPLEYREEFQQLRQEINDVWNAFFRGQLILVSVVAVSTGASMAIVGNRNALILGLISGILELLPNIGATLGAIPGVAIALFRGSSYLPIDNFWFAILVIGIYVVIQQIENNYLVPIVMGRSLNLHPFAVLLAVAVGASLAGILGLFLAAPVLATFRVLGSYAYAKLLDLEPGQRRQVSLHETEPLAREVTGGGSPNPHSGPHEADDAPADVE
jgi:predicted PurR-regulated permease PerM